MNSEEFEKKKAYSIFLLEDVLGVDPEIIDALQSGLVCISESPDKEGNFSYTHASESMQEALKSIAAETKQFTYHIIKEGSIKYFLYVEDTCPLTDPVSFHAFVYDTSNPFEFKSYFADLELSLTEAGSLMVVCEIQKRGFALI